MKAALAVVDYALELARDADQKFHDLTGAVDKFLHAQVAKLEALRERIASAAGIFGAANGDAYGALPESAKSEVDATFAAIQAAASE